eukprot:16281239-Heterocapsa_arctica.AAC.1
MEWTYSRSTPCTGQTAFLLTARSTQSLPQRTDLASAVDAASTSQGRSPSTSSARGKLLG